MLLEKQATNAWEYSWSWSLQDPTPKWPFQSPNNRLFIYYYYYFKTFRWGRINLIKRHCLSEIYQEDAMIN